MKTLITFFCLVMSTSLFAGEFSGADARTLELLERNNISVEQLERSGHQYLQGEFTGAGRSVPVSRIRHIVTNNQVVPAKDIDAVQLENNKEIPVRSTDDLRRINVDLKNVRKVEAYGAEIGKDEIRSIIYR